MNAKRTIAAVLAALVAGCVSAPKTADELAAAKRITIYAPAQLKPDQYETITRLWIESWRGQSWVQEHASAEDGITGLQFEAAKLGANALVNVACYKDEKGQFPTPWSLRPAFFCHGNAIRVRAGGS